MINEVRYSYAVIVLVTFTWLTRVYLYGIFGIRKYTLHKGKGAILQLYCVSLYQTAFSGCMEGSMDCMTNVNLSDGEWKIMNILWERERATITELTAALQEDTGWDKHIVITMLNRMEKKGLLLSGSRGGPNSFIRCC